MVCSHLLSRSLCAFRFLTTDDAQIGAPGTGEVYDNVDQEDDGLYDDVHNTDPASGAYMDVGNEGQATGGYLDVSMDEPAATFSHEDEDENGGYLDVENN